jgi:uncharacterized protein (TIGR00251 family)
LSWHRIDPRTGSLVIAIHAQPNAKRTEVVGIHGGALKVRLAAPALDGRANDCLLEFIAGRLGLKAAQLTVLQGDKSRRKLVAIAAAVDPLKLYAGEES